LLLIIVATACPQAFSADTIVRETKGQGATRDQAIRNALLEAVSQAKGVKVGSGEYSLGYQSATVDIEKKDSKKEVGFDAVSVQTEGTLHKTEFEGLVKSYDILDEKKVDDKTYEVRLKVYVFDYVAPGMTSRLRLAIMPLKTPSIYYVFGSLQMPSTEVSMKLSQNLSTSLTETNKFAVLDREYIVDFAHERGILLSDDTSLEEKAKLGKVLGADYMLVGTVSDARLQKKTLVSTAIGHELNEYEADFVFDYRVIVAPTREVKLADTVNIALETEEVKKLTKDWDPKDLDYKEMTDNLILKAANQVVENIINALYPIRIASVGKDGQIVINQGGKRIPEGLLLDVIAEGKEIIDTDTKESLGKTENCVATIKVTKVMPRIAYAELAKGDIAKISEGMVCRPQKEVQEKPAEGRKSDVERLPSGGVKLPFD